MEKVSIYRSDDFKDIVKIKKVISLAREYVNKRDFQDLSIMGDFKFHKLCWSNGSISFTLSDNGIEYELFDTLNENYLYQNVNMPNFQLSSEKCKNTLFSYNNVRKRQLNFFIKNLILTVLIVLPHADRQITFFLLKS